ncbi:WbqC-like protein [Bernardetia litoralis DSM 6794]|uniref:WbqC-like protein n=2 Tax=Bernardetia litoralis TaxID=999 RepID=I4APG5_BERLS|nr:WbqC-like protein [Bernardetia litoralis DSM 6794]
MQPAYLPWLGFFDRIEASDLFISLDNVLLDTSSKTRFTNRNKIRLKNSSTWLTLPMKTKGLFGEVHIKDIQLVEDKWNTKHWKSIQNSYRKAPFFDKYAPFLDTLYSKKWQSMQELIDELTTYFLQELKITTPVIKSSELQIDASKDDLILELCQSQNATEYYSGVFGREYLDTEKFQKEGIEVFFHEYKHPDYTQLYDGFEPYMSILDLLFNHGEDSLEIIKQGRNFVK